MKIERKKNTDRVRIVHNKKLLWIIIILIILLIILVFFIARNYKDFSDPSDNNVKECKNDNDCVPGGCCHPNSCVSLDKKPDCKGMICTQDCSGPLDCGAGHCGCVNNKCSIVKT